MSIKLAAVTISNSNVWSTFTKLAYHSWTISSMRLDLRGVVMGVTFVDDENEVEEIELPLSRSMGSIKTIKTLNWVPPIYNECNIQ